MDCAQRFSDSGSLLGIDFWGDDSDCFIGCGVDESGESISVERRFVNVCVLESTACAKATGTASGWGTMVAQASSL
jgi:hypothetical protein